MELDNAPHRLYNILKKGSEIAYDTDCRTAWGRVLNSNPNSARLTAQVGQVMLLNETAFDLVIAHFPNRQPLHELWHNKIAGAFANQQLNGQWQTFAKHIDVHTLNYLLSASDLLSTNLPVSPLENNILDELRGKLDEIYSDVLSSKHLALEVKQYLIRALTQLKTHLADYQITGVYPVIDTIESMYGHIVHDSKYKEFLSTELGIKLANALQFLANTATVGAQLAPLPFIVMGALAATGN